MNMKKLIESMDRIEECGMTEMPAMPASMPAPEQHQGNPVTMSVSLNASGKEHVDDLIKMMKNAGMGAAEPVSAPVLSPRMDMERLSGIMNGPMDDPEMEEIDDEIEVEGDYANEPDPEYGDMSDAIPNGNDLNRKKGAYKVVAGGDNPMEYTMEVEGAPAISPKFIKNLQVTFGDKEMLSPGETRKVEDMINKLSIEDVKTLVGAAIPHVSDMAKEYMRDNTPGGMKNYGEDMALNAMAVEGVPAISPKFIKHLQVTFRDKEMLSRSEERKVEDMLNKLSIENIKTLVGADIPHISDKAKEYMRDNTPGGMKNYGEDMALESKIKAQLYKALTEKKAKPDFLDIDKDGDTKEPMKKALKDKGGAAKKGQVPPQFKKKANEGIIDRLKDLPANIKKAKEKAKTDKLYNKMAGDTLKAMEPKELKPYYDAMRDKKKKTNEGVLEADASDPKNYQSNLPKSVANRMSAKIKANKEKIADMEKKKTNESVLEADASDPTAIMGQIRKMAKGVERDPDEKAHRIFAQSIESDLIDLYQMTQHAELKDLIRQNKKAQRVVDKRNANNIVQTLYSLMNSNEDMALESDASDPKAIIRQRTIELARKANVSMKNVNLDKVYKYIEQRKSLGKGPVNQQPEKIEKLIEYYQNMASKANPNYNDRVMDLIYDKVVEMVDEVAPMIHGSNESIAERDVDSNFELSSQQKAASEMARKLKSRIDMSDKGGKMLNDVDYVQLSRLAELLNKMGQGANEFSTVKDVYDEMVLNTRIRNKGTDDDGIPFNKKSKDHEPEMTVGRFKELMAMAR